VKDFVHHRTFTAGANCVLSAAGQKGIYICSYHFMGCKKKCQNLSAAKFVRLCTE